MKKTRSFPGLRIIATADQSPTLLLDALQEPYHSRHGAWAESCHVFLQAGLQAFIDEKLHQDKAAVFPRIFEMGLGTGMNAWGSLKKWHQGSYFTCESSPVDPALVEELSAYPPFVEDRELLQSLHAAPWDQWTKTQNWDLFKFQGTLEDLMAGCPEHEGFDLVYWDAFAPDKQPFLWTVDCFEWVAHHIRPGGMLCTYSAKGQVRRNMIEAGFKVERLPGPPGKREMLRGRL